MPVKMTFLDVLHPAIADAVLREVPSDWEVTFVTDGTPEARLAASRSANVLFLIGSPVPREIVASAPDLRFVQKLGAGVDNIDVVACCERGIVVARAAGGNAVPVAEHALLMILASIRRLPLMDRTTRDGAWRREEARGVHRQISGRRVGIIGMGAIGRALTQLLSGFQCEVVFHDPDPEAQAAGAALGARYMALDDVFAQADIVSLHLPLQHDTRNLVDAHRIGLMKNDAVLVNCARGGIVDEAALFSALESGRLMAAGIDTFNSEPPVGSPLLGCAATVVTPHMAGATLDNFINILRHGLRNADAVFSGRSLPEKDVVHQ